jgi:hypothetical protein
MSVLPRSTTELIEWCALRAPIWVTNAPGLGLSASQAQAVQTACTSAQGALATRDMAESEARSANEALRGEARDLRAVASDAVQLIRIFAENQAKPSNVYALAQIPAPANPSPIPPPGIPSDFTVTLQQTGDMALAWKCQNPPGSRGVVYLIERRLNAAGPYTFRAAVGQRKFVDNTIPFGTDQIDYRITAQRSDATGDPAIWTVRFGSGGGGTFTVEQIEDDGSAPAAKLAA